MTMTPDNRVVKTKPGRDIDQTIMAIANESKKYPPGSPEFIRCRQALEQELKNKKLNSELRFFGLKPDTVLIVAATFGIAFFGLALDLEYPSAMKIANFVIKLFKKPV